MLLSLLARLRVDDHLPQRDPPVVAGMRVVLVAMWRCVEGIAGWRYSVLAHISSLGCVGRSPGAWERGSVGARERSPGSMITYSVGSGSSSPST